MTSPGRRGSALAVADAMGHYVLVFAFVPTLLPVPSWLLFEISNPLNARDPVVLSFVLVRGVNLLLDAFRAHVVVGVLSGAIAGGLVSAWVRSGGRATTIGARVVLGAVAGLVGTGLALTAELVMRALGTHGGAWWPDAAVPLELASGLVCGVIAVPTAVRFLRASVDVETTPAALASGRE